MLVVLVVAGTVYERIASVGAADRFPAPGQLVDVGTTSLHLQVSRGPAGAPVVVLEAGSGETSLSWRDVPSRLSDVATVVSYDRAGTGWSEAATTSRTGEHIVDELHAALTAVGIDGPYLLVGHSMGGLFSRLFAARYPEEVAGLVLVDARPEDDAVRTAPILESAGFAGNPPVWLLSALSTTGVMRLFPDTVLAGSVDPADQARFVDVVADPEFFRVRQEEADLVGSTEDAVRGQRLGALPVVVVARGIAQDYAAAGLSPEVGQEIEDIWQDGQRRLFDLSSASRLVVAEDSGHLVPRDQPEAVVESVRAVVAEVTRRDDASSARHDDGAVAGPNALPIPGAVHVRDVDTVDGARAGRGDRPPSTRLLARWSADLGSWLACHPPCFNLRSASGPPARPTSLISSRSGPLCARTT